MDTKSQQLQIRLTPVQKVAIKRLAAAAGQDVSGYVLGRVLPPIRTRVEALLSQLADGRDRRFALAELNDLLTTVSGAELADGLAHLDVGELSPLDQNYVAAMFEQAAHMKSVAPPRWVAGVAPLELPYFATPLKGLRLHLLHASPVPFRRRNIFIDSSLGARV